MAGIALVFKKSIFLTASFLLLQVIAVAQSLDDVTFGEDDTFEVVTWNIEWFPKNGQTTVDSVSVIIPAMDVDVIAFQEIGDTALFRTMIDNIPGYSPLVLDAWSGGLAYAYKTSTVEVLDFFEIYEEEQYWNPLPRSPHVLHVLFDGYELYLINNHFKCCGDGVLQENDQFDEENRRLVASQLIEAYMDNELAGQRAIMLGDLNDLIQEDLPNNVFTPFLDEPDKYKFADQIISVSSSAYWSYPGWPSHLDHLLINNALFDDFESAESDVMTIEIDDYLAGGFAVYDAIISDHRPVAVKLKLNSTLGTTDELLPDPLRIFPVPANDRLSILIHPPHVGSAWSIVDSRGNLVLEGQLNAEFTTISIEKLAPGLYVFLSPQIGAEQFIVR